MQDATRVLAGDCTITYEDGDETREQRGEVVTLVKPDGTVLVHDADGYQPAAWLTRADVVRFARDGSTDGRGFRLVAGKGDQSIRVESHVEHGDGHYPVSPAGDPVGECPTCGGALVRAKGDVVCVSCRRSFSVPRDATVLDETCDDCGLPLFRVERGDGFAVCLDRSCESLDEAVAARFGGEWPCPECGEGMNIYRYRGLRAGCEACSRSFVVPNGRVVDTCACGLPVFETPSGSRRCLDPSCERAGGEGETTGGSAASPDGRP
ncbi:endonuclease NucS domain-containing protein [Halospeciosus flavus]|uniref:Endonuclease NucS domain-containing protein n=1 Tax=Halospeciosus flavus TaxID=3032283 RepID=A0ABD5Z6X1_9EURY|nr:endonuclease NucS domain-containing protein [Halospeciosus flavus]